MNHMSDIKAYLTTITRSEHFHALIVQSAPGWAKSTTINDVLRDENVQHISIGSYSTPLFFYNALCEHHDKTIVLDDCAGLFDNLTAMAILKAATWPVAGGGDRIVTWGSMSERVLKAKVNFTGKLILLTNVLPKGRDTEAFLSRCLFFNISFTKENIAKMLTRAAKDKKFFEKTKLAQDVAGFLVDNLDRRDYERFNLRTLRQGYELACVEPQRWKQMLEKLLPEIEPREFVKQLDKLKMSVNEQLREFQRKTGSSRRSFFLLRQELELADPRRSANMKLLAQRRHNTMKEAKQQNGKRSSR